jgi:hypothetical protein
MFPSEVGRGWCVCLSRMPWYAVACDTGCNRDFSVRLITQKGTVSACVLMHVVHCQCLGLALFGLPLTLCQAFVFPSSIEPVPRYAFKLTHLPSGSLSHTREQGTHHEGPRAKGESLDDMLVADIGNAAVCDDGDIKARGKFGNCIHGVGL